MSRAFFRQTINLGGETQKVEPDLNQLGGSQTANRVVITIGKYLDKYAHDPRNDFLNWSVLDVGTVDYAADAWGSRGRMVPGLVDRQGWPVRHVQCSEQHRS